MNKTGLPRAAIGRVRRALARQPVLFAYVFGSQAAGRAISRSDVDMAVFLEPKLSQPRRQAVRLRLLQELARALGRDDVDLVILNDAPPYLAFRVSASRGVIYSSNELARIRFEARAMALHYDRQRADERSADAMLKRVAAQGLGA